MQDRQHDLVAIDARLPPLCFVEPVGDASSAPSTQGWAPLSPSCFATTAGWV